MLTFLDLISCGFGAILVLFLLAAASRESSSGDTTVEKALLVICSPEGEGLGELALQYKRKNESHWHFATGSSGSDSVLKFSGSASPDKGGDAFVLIPNPPRGVWEFRAVLRYVTREGPIKPAFEIHGAEILNKGTDVLRRPGDTRKIEVVIADQ